MELTEKPNIIWIMFDSLRNEFLNEFGGEAPRTYIDNLIAKGVAFTNCHSAAPFTVVSMASKMTGCYPSLHGIDGWLKKDPTKEINANCIRLPEILQYNGYETFYMMNERFGIYVNHVGFDHYFSKQCEYKDLPYEEFHRAPSPKMAMVVVEDLHNDCCNNQGNYYHRDFIDSYVTTSKKVEEIVERLRTGNDMIIITSDHGIRCLDDFDHDLYNSEFTTGRYLTEKTTHNSFNIIWEGVLKPHKFDNFCRSVDIYPTIIDILGFEYPKLDGVSLKPLFAGKTLSIPYAFSLTGWSCTHPDRPGAWCIKDSEFKVVIMETKYGLKKKLTSYLYNYKKDPQEIEDLSDIFPKKKEQLIKAGEKILFCKRNIINIYKQNGFDYKKYLNFRENRKNYEIEKEISQIIRYHWKGYTRRNFLRRYRLFRLKAIIYWQFRPLFNLFRLMGFFKSDVVY